MTFHDIMQILNKRDLRYSYEVSQTEDIIAVYVEHSGPTADKLAEDLGKIMPDYKVHNFSNLNYIQIERKKDVVTKQSK